VFDTGIHPMTGQCSRSEKAREARPFSRAQVGCATGEHDRYGSENCGPV